MKKFWVKSTFLCILLFNSYIIYSQIPDWADDTKRKLRYPDNEYLVGYATEKNSNNENPQDILNRISGYAKGQLIEYVQVKVQSQATQEVTENNENLQRKFSSVYSASSSMELTGLKIETIYDQKSKTGYAIAYAKKNDLYTYYKGLIESGLTSATQKIEEAKTALSNNDVQRALKASLEASNALPGIEQAQKILLALKAGNVTEADIQNQRSAMISTSTGDIIRSAQKSAGNTADEASFFLARGLKLQTGKVPSPVFLTNFTYQDTKMASELSRRLSQSLASKLVSEGGYAVETESSAGAKGYVLTGTFWKEPNEIKIIGTMKDLSGKIIATAEAFIPLSWFQNNNVNYMPENFEEAASKMRVFGQNELVKGDLNVEVWTNKGDDNLLFTEGEKLKIYLRANKPCYVRLIYYIASGERVLLKDSYYIAENMVNKVIEIDDEFECAEPFGVETLQANAQTEEFEKLQTYNQDGYEFIRNSLEEVLVKTRGFKKVASKELQKAEKRLIFTTMSK